MDKQKIAEKLISLRGKRTQSEVAKALNISQSSYAMYETGKRIPSDEVKIAIAQYYEKTVQEIFFDLVLTKSEVL